MKKLIEMLRPLMLVLIFLIHKTACALEKPNIIMIFIDDLGWGDFSCFGNKDAKTPNIDRLAAEGIRFEQFYVNAPICSPSRCALTTGQYPQRWKITSYLNNRADNERRGVAQWLDPSAPSLPRILRDSGYMTGHFGKWHLGGQRDVDDAPAIAEYGFGESLTNFEGIGPKLLPLTMSPAEENPGRIWGDAERLGGPVVWMQRSEITRGFADAALAFITRAVRHEKPFYINLWPDDVHGPLWPPIDQWAEAGRPRYLAVLESMDRQFGRLFEHIETTPALRNNTIILICSDNGPDVNAGSAGPFRGTKATLYEGGIRSPLIVWAPGFISKDEAGTANTKSYFAAFDLMPSLLSIAGVTAPAGIELDGEDFSAVLLGHSEKTRIRPLFWRRPPDRKVAYGSSPLPDLAVRENEWKLMCEYDGSKPELYHLIDDASEQNNVADVQPEVVARLKRRVLDWNASMPADMGPTLEIEKEKPRKQH